MEVVGTECHSDRPAGVEEPAVASESSNQQQPRVPHPCQAWVGKHKPQSSESAFNAGCPIHAQHGSESTNLNPRNQLSCGVPHPCEAWVGKHEPQPSESAFMRGAPSMRSMGGKARTSILGISFQCGVPHPCEAWVGKHEAQFSETAFMRSTPSMPSMGGRPRLPNPWNTGGAPVSLLRPGKARMRQRRLMPASQTTPPAYSQSANQSRCTGQALGLRCTTRSRPP